MSSPYFHPQEEFEVWAIESYEQERPGTRYLIEFADGESYVCLFDTAYDSENAGELDIETDHPLYDEFHQVSLRIIRTVQRGLRPYNEWLNLDYRDFPSRIIDLDTESAVYPERQP